MTRRDCLASLLVGPFTVGEVSDQQWLVPRASDVELPNSGALHRVTFYCPCDWCCGVWRVEDGRRVELLRPASGVTSRGHPPIEGCTVAVDPRVWPYGTLIFIDGIGLRIASDCGQDIKGRRLDVFVDSHEEAVRRGRLLRRAKKFSPRVKNSFTSHPRSV